MFQCMRRILIYIYETNNKNVIDILIKYPMFNGLNLYDIHVHMRLRLIAIAVSQQSVEREQLRRDVSKARRPDISPGIEQLVRAPTPLPYPDSRQLSLDYSVVSTDSWMSSSLSCRC